MGKKRFQLQIWLDVTKDVDHELLIASDELKRQRKFAKTIRDGFRLILDLQAGNIDVLLELAPWIAQRLIATPTLPATSVPEPKREQPLGFHNNNALAELDDLVLNFSEDTSTKKNSNSQNLLDQFLNF